MTIEHEESLNKYITSIINKAKEYDKVKAENEQLKRKLVELQSANDGYREVLSYKDSIIDRYGECVGRLCGINYEKQGSAVLSEDLIDVLDVVSTSEAAMDIGDTFRDAYNKSHPYEGYNPNFDIDALKNAINETSNMIRNNNPYTRFNNGLKPRTYHIFIPGEFQVNDIPYTGEDDEI